MRRSAARTFFGVSAALAGATLLVAIGLALGPKTPPKLEPDAIPLTRFDALHANIPLKLALTDLVGLDRIAHDQRERGYLSLWRARSRPDGLPVFIVRSDGSVRAFLAVDPRTGCDLIDRTGGTAAPGVVAFEDACHGTTYDLSGRRKGGPGAWSLDELVLHVRDGMVFAHTHKVIPGAFALPY